jgi:hypothetical protein
MLPTDPTGASLSHGEGTTTTFSFGPARPAPGLPTQPVQPQPAPPPQAGFGFKNVTPLAPDTTVPSGGPFGFGGFGALPPPRDDQPFDFGFGAPTQPQPRFSLQPDGRSAPAFGSVQTPTLNVTAPPEPSFGFGPPPGVRDDQPFGAFGAPTQPQLQPGFRFGPPAFGSVQPRPAQSVQQQPPQAPGGFSFGGAPPQPSTAPLSLGERPDPAVEPKEQVSDPPTPPGLAVVVVIIIIIIHIVVNIMNVTPMLNKGVRQPGSGIREGGGGCEEAPKCLHPRRASQARASSITGDNLVLPRC